MDVGTCDVLITQLTRPAVTYLISLLVSHAECAMHCPLQPRPSEPPEHGESLPNPPSPTKAPPPPRQAESGNDVCQILDVFISIMYSKKIE